MSEPKKPTIKPVNLDGDGFAASMKETQAQIDRTKAEILRVRAEMLHQLKEAAASHIEDEKTRGEFLKRIEKRYGI